MKTNIQEIAYQESLNRIKKETGINSSGADLFCEISDKHILVKPVSQSEQLDNILADQIRSFLQQKNIIYKKGLQSKVFIFKISEFLRITKN